LTVNPKGPFNKYMILFWPILDPLPHVSFDDVTFLILQKEAFLILLASSLEKCNLTFRIFHYSSINGKKDT